MLFQNKLKVYRQNDIYDTDRVCLGARKTLFTLKTILQKYRFFVKAVAFLVGGKSKLYIHGRICLFDECILYTF